MHCTDNANVELKCINVFKVNVKNDEIAPLQAARTI